MVYFVLSGYSDYSARNHSQCRCRGVSSLSGHVFVLGGSDGLTNRLSKTSLIENRTRMGSESGQSPMRFVPPVATRVVSSMQRMGLNFKPSSSERRKSEHFLADHPPQQVPLKKSPLIPINSQLEHLNVSKTPKDNFCESRKNYEKHHPNETASSVLPLGQFHEKLPSWPETKYVNDTRRQSSFNEQLPGFSSSMNEKLQHKKQRPDRGSFCKSTISSHDSGIGMQDDSSLTATPISTPTVESVNRILQSRLVMNNCETGNESLNKCFDPKNDTDIWFGTSTPLLKRKSLGVLSNRFDDIPLIDENPSSVVVAHKNPTSPDYDSETLRKSAQKNREIAARLLPKLQRTSPRSAKYAPQCHHERQLSLDSRDTTDQQNPKSQRLVTKSPSQLSCSGSSSIYTESSNGTMSSNGDNPCTNVRMFTSVRDTLKSYHEEQRDLIWRSVSIDTLGSEFTGTNAKSLNTYLTNFNQPQQRKNIVSMVSATETQNVSPPTVNTSHFTGNANDNINFKEKNLARSMPNLNQTNVDEANEDLSIDNYFVDSYALSSNTNGGQSLQGDNFTKSSFESPNLKRSGSPIYAVPDRSHNFRSSLFDMKNPPPLPKKPPPSFMLEHRLANKNRCDGNLPDCDHEIITTSKSRSNIVSSTSASVDDLQQRCAVNGVVRRGIIMPHCDNSVHLLNQRCQNTAQCYNDGGAGTATKISTIITNGNNESQPSRGRNTPVSKRPIVPVHPYNEQDLVVGTAYQNGFNEISSPKSVSLSPRPPVPPKPEKIISKPPPQLPPKPTAIVQTQETPKNQGPDKCEPQIRLRTAEDDDMSRRSRIVAENSNDAGLINILVGQQRQSVDYISIVFDRTRAQPFNTSGAVKVDQNYHINETNGAHNETTSKNSIASELKSSILPNGTTVCSKADNPLDLEKEKKNLIVSLTSKLSVLKKTFREVEQEIRYNDSLGQSIRTIIDTSNASVHDKESFRLHVEDTEKVTHLLLKLSAQLARVENDLNRMPITSSPKEKQSLTGRRQRLMVQLQDAKCLKEDLDRRGDDVTMILRNVFDDDQMADYQYFIQMKSQLLIDAREIEDKIKLGEDQKNALENSLSKPRASE